MTEIKKISNFTLHGSTGLSVLDSNFLAWLETHSSSELGRITAYGWRVGDNDFQIEIDIGKRTWRVLPDATGFIAFESDWKPDNCLLLDVYGKERMRLTVPWEMTGSTHPESARAPTSFANASVPYEHPQTGEKGRFGVTAWVERMGKFYFELDYHAGKFLWCRQIRD